MGAALPRSSGRPDRIDGVLHLVMVMLLIHR